jgi:hypothetical protein
MNSECLIKQGMTHNIFILRPKYIWIWVKQGFIYHSENNNRLQTNHNQTDNQIYKAVKQLTQIFGYEVETLWIQRKKPLWAAKHKKSTITNKQRITRSLALTKPLQSSLSWIITSDLLVCFSPIPF